MEAEKSHDLLSASQRTRKASAVVQSQVQRPKNQQRHVQGQEKVDVPLKQTERIHPSSAFLFYSGLQ